MLGVAVVTRKGPFMAKKDLFIKKGFIKTDEAKPDFELFALKFSTKSPNPKFTLPLIKDYPNGLTIIRSPECPILC